MTQSFSHKIIWLVGASEGIGEALAHQLSGASCHLVLSARNAQRLHELAAQLPKGSCSVMPLDVTDLASIQQAWQQMRDSNHIPHVVIYNAGTYVPMSATSFDLPQVMQMLDVNLHGALRVLSCVLPEFIANHEGHIALVASVAGYRGLPSAMGYGASKAALMHVAENLKVDLALTNIKVQVINPGFVATRLTALNDFSMPCIITAKEAARYIYEGLQTSAFEIHFPKRFSRLLKCLQLLPHSVYFWLLRRRVEKRKM